MSPVFFALMHGMIILPVASLDAVAKDSQADVRAFGGVSEVGISEEEELAQQKAEKSRSEHVSDLGSDHVSMSIDGLGQIDRMPPQSAIQQDHAERSEVDSIIRRSAALINIMNDVDARLESESTSSGLGYTMIKDGWCCGYDYLQIRGSQTAATCADICEKQNGCKAFSFQKNNAGLGCRLSAGSRSGLDTSQPCGYGWNSADKSKLVENGHVASDVDKQCGIHSFADNALYVLTPPPVTEAPTAPPTKAPTAAPTEKKKAAAAAVTTAAPNSAASSHPGVSEFAGTVSFFSLLHAII